VESGDWLVIAPVLYALILNVVVLAQIFIYAQKPGDEGKKEK